MALKKRWLTFAEEYLRSWNKTRAAEVAGYAHPGQAGYRLFKIVQIQEYIQRRIEEKCMSADEVLVRLAQAARFDVGPFIDIKTWEPEPQSDEEVREETSPTIINGLLINWERLVEAGLTHLVKAIYDTKYGTRIEFHDPQHALELIGKHHGLFVERQEISGAGGGPVRIIAIGGINPDDDV